MKWRAAIVGVGQAGVQGSATNAAWKIGHVHAKTYLASDRFDLCAAADISQGNLDYFIDLFPQVTSSHLGIDEMLAEMKPDVVSICTYAGTHAEMIRKCVAAGVKGIVCEKPLVSSPRELTAIRTLIAQSGVKLIVPHFRRYMPAFAHVGRRVGNGEFGAPVSFSAAIGNGWDLAEWGSHWMDMFRFLNNDAMPDYVLAQARVTDRRGFGHAIEDHAVAAMGFASGLTAYLEVGPKYLPDSLTMVLNYANATIQIRNENHVTILGAGGAEVHDFSAGHDILPAWGQLFDSLARWLDGGPASPLRFEIAAGTAETCFACYQSMISGDRIDLPLQSDVGVWPVELLAKPR